MSAEQMSPSIRQWARDRGSRPWYKDGAENVKFSLACRVVDCSLPVLVTFAVSFPGENKNGLDLSTQGNVLNSCQMFKTVS